MACVEIKFTVHLHAIDATRARWRGDAGSSLFDLHKRPARSRDGAHTGGGRARRDGAHALEQTSRGQHEGAVRLLPLFAAAAAYAARRLRAQHASSLGDAFARQDGRAGAGADAAAFASYAAAAAHASSLRRHRAAAGWGVVLCAAPVLLFLRVPRKEGRRLPSLISSGVLRAAPRDGRRQFRAGRGLGPRSYIVARAHGARPRRRPRSINSGARGAGRRRRGRDARAPRRERGARELAADAGALLFERGDGRRPAPRRARVRRERGRGALLRGAERWVGGPSLLCFAPFWTSPLPGLPVFTSSAAPRQNPPVGVRFDGGAIMSSGRRVVAGSGRRSAGGVGAANAAKSSRCAEGGAGRSPQTFLPTTRRQTKASRHCWIASPLPTG